MSVDNSNHKVFHGGNTKVEIERAYPMRRDTVELPPCQKPIPIKINHNNGSTTEIEKRLAQMTINRDEWKNATMELLALLQYLNKVSARNCKRKLPIDKLKWEK